MNQQPFNMIPLSCSADTSGMLDTSLKRENSGEFEEDLPIEVNLPCNEDLQVAPDIVSCQYCNSLSATSIFSHQMLLNRIELQLPKDDHVKYDSRARKLDWDQIKFKDYSAEDCKKYWEHIQVHFLANWNTNNTKNITQQC